MNAPLTPKDWELISTYLDGQLTAAEKRLVMDQLALRPELAQGLEELRRTRAVLRAAPRRRAPRNFTLTPAMVGKSRRGFSWSWAPSLGFASALATILLVLSFFVQWSPAGLTAAAPPMAAPISARQGVNASETNPPVITWNNTGDTGPAFGMGGGLGSADSTIPLPQPSMVPDLQAPAASTAATQPAITGEKATTTSATPEATAVAKALAPQASLQATVAPASAPANAGPILGIAPTEERGNMVVPTQERALEDAITAQSRGSSWPWVRLALGAAALVSGLAALWLWRRSRH